MISSGETSNYSEKMKLKSRDDGQRRVLDITIVQHMHDNWERYKDMRPSKITDEMLDTGVLTCKRDSMLLIFIGGWKQQIPLLENEGLWVPLKIKDLKGWISEVGQPDSSKPAHIEAGKIRMVAMKQFFTMLGGQKEGNTYSSQIRGIMAYELLTELMHLTGKSREYIRNQVIDPICLYGALRRMETTPRIIMIPTPEQMVYAERKTMNEMRDFWGAKELPAAIDSQL